LARRDAAAQRRVGLAGGQRPAILLELAGADVAPCSNVVERERLRRGSLP
jgi:hypothetical protein